MMFFTLILSVFGLLSLLSTVFQSQINISYYWVSCDLVMIQKFFINTDILCFYDNVQEFACFLV